MSDDVDLLQGLVEDKVQQQDFIFDLLLSCVVNCLDNYDGDSYCDDCEKLDDSGVSCFYEGEGHL
jgi:hypothetical protein